MSHCVRRRSGRASCIVIGPDIIEWTTSSGSGPGHWQLVCTNIELKFNRFHFQPSDLNVRTKQTNLPVLMEFWEMWHSGAKPYCCLTVLQLLMIQIYCVTAAELFPPSSSDETQPRRSLKFRGPINSNFKFIIYTLPAPPEATPYPVASPWTRAADSFPCRGVILFPECERLLCKMPPRKDLITASGRWCAVSCLSAASHLSRRCVEGRLGNQRCRWFPREEG